MVTAMDDEFPVGARLDGGEVVISEAIRGDSVRGLFRAIDRGGRRLLVTVTTRQKQPLDQLEDDLGFIVDGLARLRHIGPVGDGDSDEYHAMVEEEPAGRPSSELPLPLPPRAAVELAAELAEVLERAHAAGLLLLFLRPELVYIDEREGALHVSGVVPRPDLFVTGATAAYGAKPLFDHLFAAPEVLAMQASVTAAADVFSLAAVVAVWVTGEHPFAGDTPTAQLGAIVNGRRRPWRGPAGLELVLARALDRRPAARPSLPALVRDLLAAAG
jgi:serine/threonine protein kinase